VADKPSFGKLDIRLGTAIGVEEAGAHEADAPFLIAVLGDFSGRGNRGVVETGPNLAERAVRLVDRDNLEEVMKRLKVGVEIALDSGPRARMDLDFAELDDFHPDRIYGRHELFQSLRTMRKRLADPATFREAAAELGRSATPAEPAAEKAAAGAAPEAGAAPPEGLLDQILETAQGDALVQQIASNRVDWEAVVHKIVEPYVLPGRDPMQPKLVADVDNATGRHMRALLHHPDFQQLEAAWRGLDFLTRRLETGGDLKICLVDVTKAELEADLRGGEDLAASATYRLLVDRSVGTPGADRWALLVGHYTFAATVADAELLGRLAKIARAAGAAIVAGAAPSLIGCAALAESPDPDDWQSPPPADVQDAWQVLRQLPEASHVGLILPRFLLRLPYGRETAPTESFVFEELPETPPAHAAYLWGNPAWAAACLIGQAFTARGWQLRPGIISQLDDLSVHVYKADGEPQLTPCAETLLTDRAAEKIVAHGLMPLRSVRGADSAILGPFVSLAEPAKELRGRWI